MIQRWKALVAPFDGVKCKPSVAKAVEGAIDHTAFSSALSVRVERKMYVELQD